MGTIVTRQEGGERSFYAEKDAPTAAPRSTTKGAGHLGDTDAAGIAAMYP